MAIALEPAVDFIGHRRRRVCRNSKATSPQTRARIVPHDRAFARCRRAFGARMSLARRRFCGERSRTAKSSIVCCAGRKPSVCTKSPRTAAKPNVWAKRWRGCAKTTPSRFRFPRLARHCGMSASALHQGFKQLTAMTPLQYQKQLRLQEARRLMSSEGLDAARAGFAVGYGDPSYFSRDYKRVFGEPPRQHAARTHSRSLVKSPMELPRRGCIAGSGSNLSNGCLREGAPMSALTLRDLKICAQRQPSSHA